MKAKRTVEHLVCDACDYSLTRDGTSAKGKLVAVLTVPYVDGKELTFHFHSPNPKPDPSLYERNDCLRYFFSNPEIIRRALERRGIKPAQIETFLAQVAYRPGH